MLDTPLGAVELAVDRGRIVAGERVEEISEIELELLDGSAAAIFQLAQELSSSIALQPSIRSKAARGFDLASGSAPKASKAPRPKLDDDATLDQAVHDILHSAIRHLMESQPAAENGQDSEGIHQYRVAIRRLRAVLGLVRSIAPSSRLDAFRDDAKWLMSNLDDARAWDVFITESLPHVSQACPTVKGFDVVEGEAQKLQSKAHDKARAAVTDPRTGGFQIALGLWIEQTGWRADASPEGLHMLAEPARGFGAKFLEKLNRKVLKRGRNFRKLSPDERHKVRLALKKLRYSADFFLPLLGTKKASRRYAKRLARLQDQLGRYNDVSTLDELVQQIVRSRMPAAGHHAAGALIGWQAGNLKPDDLELVSAWKKFQGAYLPR